LRAAGDPDDHPPSQGLRMNDHARELEPTCSGPRILHTSPVVGIAEVGSVCMVVWRGPVTPESFEQQWLALHALTNAHPRDAGFLCVIEPDCPPPEPPLRQASLRMIDQHSERLQGVACVIEGRGIRAAIARSVLSSLALLRARRDLPFSFVASLHAGASWLAPRCSVPARALWQADRELRAAMSCTR
jgi:hypothetical protein